MSLNAFPARTANPNVVEALIRVVGTGASNPTNSVAPGVVVTRTGTGTYRITWNDAPGLFLNATFTLSSDAMTDVKNFSLIPGAYDAANKRIDCTLFNGSGTATDLAAAQYISVVARFARTGVSA